MFNKFIIPPRMGKKVDLLAAKFEKKSISNKSDSSAKMAVPKLSKSSSQLKQVQQSNRKIDDYEAWKSLYSGVIEEFKSRYVPKLYAPVEENHEQDSSANGNARTTKEEQEQPKVVKKQATRKAETDEASETKRRKIVAANQGLTESDDDKNSESEVEEEQTKSRPKRGAAKKQLTNRVTKKADKKVASESKELEGVEKTAATRKAPVQPQPVASTSGNINLPFAKEKSNHQNETAAMMSEKKSQRDNGSNPVPNGRMTVADEVRDASQRLIQMNGYASLFQLKKMLLSERDELWVDRNYERMKATIKQMFATAEIVPYDHLKSTQNHSVSIKFKFDAANKKTGTAKKGATKTIEAKKTRRKPL